MTDVADKPRKREFIHATGRSPGPSHKEIKARMDEIPPDTRSFTGRLLGDPVPSRSALSRKIK